MDPAGGALNLTGASICILSPVVVLIKFGPTTTIPEVNTVVNASDPPPLILEVIYALIARCVETILLLSAVKVASVLNSLITVPVPPAVTPPILNSSNPPRLNKLALIVTEPVDCSTLNNSPTRKLPS